MVEFTGIAGYEAGIVHSLLCRSFAELLNDALEEKIKSFDKDIFENPDTIGACTFISTLGGEAVGMASWDPRQGPAVGVIGYNCILPEYQGKGFGTAQIKEILRRLKKDGFKKVMVRTGEHPFFVSAQKMYAACGFSEKKRYETGDQPGYGTIDYEIEVS